MEVLCVVGGLNRMLYYVSFGEYCIYFLLKFYEIRKLCPTFETAKIHSFGTQIIPL